MMVILGLTRSVLIVSDSGNLREDVDGEWEIERFLRRRIKRKCRSGIKGNVCRCQARCPKKKGRAKCKNECLELKWQNGVDTRRRRALLTSNCNYGDRSLECQCSVKCEKSSSKEACMYGCMQVQCPVGDKGDVCRCRDMCPTGFAGVDCKNDCDDLSHCPRLPRGWVCRCVEKCSKETLKIECDERCSSPY